MNTLEPLHFEIEQSTDPATGALTTTFHCHGRLLSSTAADLKDEVRPLVLKQNAIQLLGLA